MAKTFYGSFEKPKKAKKKKPKNNKRITEYIECERCHAQAEETHEVFFGNPARQVSIENGWQEKLCKLCHQRVHSDIMFRRLMQSEWQEKIMYEKGWTIDDWRKNTGFKNYIGYLD